MPLENHANLLTPREVADRLNVSVRTVERYQKKGLLTPVRNPANGFRMFRIADVDRLRMPS